MLKTDSLISGLTSGEFIRDVGRTYEGDGTERDVGERSSVVVEMGKGGEGGRGERGIGRERGERDRRGERAREEVGREG